MERKSAHLLDAKSLLSKIYRRVTRKRTVRKFRFFNCPAWSRYDYCPESLTASMSYLSAKIIRVGDDYWLIALGNSVGGELAAEFVGDIIAIRVPKYECEAEVGDLVRRARVMIAEHRNLSASVVAFKQDGTVLWNHNSDLAIDVCGRLSTVMYSLAVRRRVVRANPFNPILGTHMVDQEMLYRQESVGVMANILLDVL